MITLTDLSKNELTKGIRNLSPLMGESNIVRNRLIDGSQHVQVIGEPSEYITFEALSSHNQTEKINYARGTGEILELIIYNEAYQGIITEEIYWERFDKRYKNKDNTHYIGSIRLEIIRGLENEAYKHDPLK